MRANQFTVSLKPEDISRVAKGLTYQTAIELWKSGAYQIRVAVRDAATGSLGSANAFVIVPDFNRPRITLSSLMLSGTGGGSLVSDVATREFHPGETVAYACEVYGTKGSAELSIRVFHDGAAAFEGALMKVNLAAGEKTIPVVGKLEIPMSLAEGDYQVELIARDPQAPAKQQSTSQWTDFTVVNAAAK